MIHHLVQFALRQRFLILMLMVFLVGGAISFQHMPVDAYPDLAPPMVEIITQWPGHAAEEIERLVTLPTEVEMNGVPKMSVMRSISLYGLSDVILTFDEDTDDYFARQVVFQRLSEVTYPTGVTPSLAPLSSPSGLVYRYVIQSPDRTPQELKTFEDWVIEREYKQVRGVADDSGFGGTVMQYQVLLDPARLYGYHITVPTILQQLGQQFQCGRRLLFAGRPVLLRPGTRADSRHTGCRRRGDRFAEWRAGARAGRGRSTIGSAPRLGEFGFNKTDDAVEGVIMMLRGQQTQNVLKGVEEKPSSSTSTSCRRRESTALLRPQRSGAADHRHRGAQPGAGHGAGADRADVLPGERARRGDCGADDSAGAAFFVHFSARAGRGGEPAFDRRDRFRDHHRWNAGDGREHLPRARRCARGRNTICRK
jgi:cobalt-zinc-cadmium resistance protein CzcA